MQIHSLLGSRSLQVAGCRDKNLCDEPFEDFPRIKVVRTERPRIRRRDFSACRTTFWNFSAKRFPFLSARVRARLHLHRGAVYPVFPGRQPRARDPWWIAFLSCTHTHAYVSRTRRVHEALHLHFASKRTGAVKLRRNHREFLRRKKGRWLSGEDPFSSWRRETTVIGGTFLSKCSFLSRHSREHGGLSPPPPLPLAPVLHRMRSIASPGVTCCRGNSLYTATLCYHSLPESIKHHEIRNIKRTRTMSDPTERNLIEMLFFSTICFKFLRIHIANFVALKYYSF